MYKIPEKYRGRNCRSKRRRESWFGFLIAPVSFFFLNYFGEQTAHTCIWRESSSFALFILSRDFFWGFFSRTQINWNVILAPPTLPLNEAGLWLPPPVHDCCAWDTVLFNNNSPLLYNTCQWHLSSVSWGIFWAGTFLFAVQCQSWRFASFQLWGASQELGILPKLTWTSEMNSHHHKKCSLFSLHG